MKHLTARSRIAALVAIVALVAFFCINWLITLIGIAGAVVVAWAFAVEQGIEEDRTNRRK